MNQKTVLNLYEKIEALVRRLPGPLQKAITEELSPLKQIFIAQRPARLVLVGQASAPAEQLFSALVNSRLDISDLTSQGAWLTFHHRGLGGFRLLDARRLSQTSHSWRELEEALGQEQPDGLLFLVNGAQDFDLALECEQATRIVDVCKRRHQVSPPLIGVIDFPANLDERKRRERLLQLRAWLDGQPEFKSSFVRVVEVCSFARFRQDGTLDLERDERKNITALAELLVQELPSEAQVELARLLQVRSVQRLIAQKLVRSMAAISAAIGAQPIPLADFPILTTLQLAMVAGVMYLGGRELSVRSAAEFCAAVGTNIGLGMVLREGARAAIKVVPLWGSAIAGGVAAAGTFAVGRAATAVFIEGKTLEEARRLLRRFGRRKSALDH
ncbi:MAG: hypothetical protein JO069_07725 [Verrucomicrobia bacterium]|nr:hypothetical protein [Verrucomicrobiota bacterium]